MKRWIVGLGVCMLLAVAGMVSLSSAADVPAMMVGRIFYIEGDLLRYVPEEKDWVALVKDAPFGQEDTLFSGDRGMAELIIPNGTWIRIGNSTQIQFIALDTDLSEMDVASGVARFYNKSSDTVIKVTSPFGYVLSYPGTVFDFYVGEKSVEVVSVKGQVSFIHSATEAKYNVAAGSPSILADQQQVSSDEGIVDPDWNRWNATRENFWAAKARLKGRSIQYLPPSLHDESYALDENGSWERVSYEGSERWFWRPRVAVGWSPFTVGRWTDWYGDQTWIPEEPFGYVTHHYGNWIYARNYWYWAPPVVAMRMGLPLLDIGFFWSPGRVSWIHSGAYVGWVPLAPRETYYCHRRWGGPHAVVITNASLPQININLRNYAYVNRAIVVPQKDFYDVNNYKNVRVTSINPATIISTYRAAPVVNNTMIRGYTTDKQRYNFTNVKVNEKPHNTVIQRIQQNQSIIREGRKDKASLVQERAKSLPEGRVNREARIEAPKITNHIVPAGDMNRPKSEIKFQQKEIKGRREGSGEARPGVTTKPGQPTAKPVLPAARPERVAPARPGQQEKPGQPARPERLIPPKPAQPGLPATRPERVAPARPGQQEKPPQPARPERLTPPKPAQPEQPAPRPERLAPVRPSPKERPPQPARPERLTPPKPAQPEQPAPRPERVAPVRPSPQERPPQPARPERLIPPKPAQPEQPAPRPERVAPVRPSPQERPPQPARPERLTPPKPAQPEQPAPRPERLAPVRPSPKERPPQPARPERLTPPKPAQPEQPAPRPERVAPAKPAEKGPPQKQIEKPKDQRPSENDAEKPREQKRNEEERGKSK